MLTAPSTPPMGNYVVLDHGGGWETRYLHLKHNSLKVRAGDRVAAGQPLGFMGTTGYSTGVHLHFEVRFNGDRLDPKPYLRQEAVFRREESGAKQKTTSSSKKSAETAAKTSTKPPAASILTPEPSLYKVKRGDTLWAISRQFGTTVDALVKLNGIQNPNLILAGQVLKLK